MPARSNNGMHRAALALPLLAFLVGAVSFPGLSVADEADVRRETQLKSGYLLNFVKFVEWPQAAPGEPLTICFLGAASMRETLEVGIESKRVGTRPLAVRQLQESGKMDGCDVLYVEEKWALTLSIASHEPRPPILTVSDAKDFAHKGGIIELFTDDNHLRFVINVDNAHRAGLRISSSLLQLAAVVEQGKP
jgi:YfiR/HmsC-like